MNFNNKLLQTAAKMKRLKCKDCNLHCIKINSPTITGLKSFYIFKNWLHVLHYEDEVAHDKVLPVSVSECLDCKRLTLSTSGARKHYFKLNSKYAWTSPKNGTFVIWHHSRLVYWGKIGYIVLNWVNEGHSNFLEYLLVSWKPHCDDTTPG